MANYNNKEQGFIECLSDFWLIYFKEIDQLEVLYRGTDILIGQAYLDMLSLLLNNSLQDAPLFNKEYFKLLQMRETDLVYLQGVGPDTNLFKYTPTDNLVTAKSLNNKIFTVTAALNEHVDYDVDLDARTFNFRFDPLNAYLQRNFGSGNSAFTLRTKDPLTQSLSVQLLDTGSASIIIASNAPGTAITITYDGPANGGTAKARDIVAAVNTQVPYNTLLFAELAIVDGGTASPVAVGVLALKRAAVNPLDDYAARVVESSFGASLKATRILSWVDAGVQKGDIIRLLTGPTIATPQEFIITLVRDAVLYTSTGVAITDVKASDKTEFAILREPASNTSISEPLPVTGLPVQVAADGVTVSSTRVFSSASASFSVLHVGTILQFSGTLNIGYYRILDVLTSTSVTLATTVLFDDTSVPWTLLSNVAPASILADGVIANEADGTVSFSSAAVVFIKPVVGTVIKIYRSGVFEYYEVADFVTVNKVLIRASDSVTGTGLTWGWANHFMPMLSLAYPQIKAATTTITARRQVDEGVAVEGTDFVIDEDNATIKALTVWRTDIDLLASYEYRLAIVPHTTTLQSGADGTLSFGNPSTFSSPTASFTYNDIGQAIKISGSSIPGSTNNGTYIIATVFSATIVTLTIDRAVNSTADAANGSLTWEERHRSTFSTENVTALVREMAFWVPDALVDRYHLYNTFGYLINRFQQSSEDYRSLIRGIFQLFMLGPTLERFESAVNTVAGLPVVRDDGEILLGYENNTLQTGADGFLNSTNSHFTAASATFVFSASARYLYLVSGLNSGKLYKVVGYVDSQTIVLDAVPTTEGPVSWEFNSTDTHQVSTSKRNYVYNRRVPLRSTVTDSANIGVKIFRAFEVLTDAFAVTDYIETPLWWERVQIPEVLWTGEDALRRQSTPALFENTIGASDCPHIGDPGFLIGADSLGFVPPSVVTNAGAADGVLIVPINFGVSGVIEFTTVTAPFTSNDLGNVIFISDFTPERRFRISEVLSSTHVKLEAFENLASASSLTWRLESKPVVLRNKAAFVVIDTWLKHHLFFLSFDPILLAILGSELITDLQSLVLVAKPTYTYIILTPSSLFKEAVQINEDTLVIESTP